MTGLQIFILVVALLVLAGTTGMWWLQLRRRGGVLIADPTDPTPTRPELKGNP
ncbi:MAG: hypothetical protein ABMA25_04925 [Ilumatobacteraceae bacterium]